MVIMVIKSWNSLLYDDENAISLDSFKPKFHHTSADKKYFF